jgi:hypothetical protein
VRNFGLENAKRHAAERDITLSALVEDALRVLLLGTRTPTVEPFHLYTVRGTLADSTLDLDRTSALIAIDDERDYAKRQR